MIAPKNKTQTRNAFLAHSLRSECVIKIVMVEWCGKDSEGCHSSITKLIFDYVVPKEKSFDGEARGKGV